MRCMHMRCMHMRCMHVRCMHVRCIHVPFSNVDDPVSHDALYIVFQDEIKKRKDFRKECVFTIDPETARVSKK